MKKKIGIILFIIAILLVGVFFGSRLRIVEGNLEVTDLCLIPEGCGPDYYLDTHILNNGLSQYYGLYGRLNKLKKVDDGTPIRVFGLSAQKHYDDYSDDTYDAIYVLWHIELK